MRTAWTSGPATISAGFAFESVRDSLGWGVTGATTDRVLDNTINGGFYGRADRFESNQVRSGKCNDNRTQNCPAVLWQGGGTLRNNCITARPTLPGNFPSNLFFIASAFAEADAESDPLVFESNDLFVYGGGALYFDESPEQPYNLPDFLPPNALTTADQVALTDMTVSGTTDGQCAAAAAP